MVNTILKEADLFCPNSVRINFTIYHKRGNLDGVGPVTISLNLKNHA
ncbi:Aspartate aminotransferase [Levilactobacillus zymae]|uniref:Aspartate aminotransferase n=1 Tax=Levilactobacillus zymae TaxID=267363 RepID=A0A1Y6K1E6_9LACO|nr:Aspartate aminotransferase [Levilactobacillus zymae]